MAPRPLSGFALPCLALVASSASAADAPASPLDTAPASPPATVADTLLATAPATAPASLPATAPDPPASYWKARPLAIEGQLALAGPLGGAGLALDLAVTDWFAINGGVGVGSGAEGSTVADRIQLALTPRLRHVVRREAHAQMAIGIEAGLSTGSYLAHFECLFSSHSCVFSAWKRVLWQNTNLGFEVRRDGGFHVRVFGGIGTPLAAEPTRNCRTFVEGISCRSPRGDLPSMVFNIGAAVGYAF